MAVILVVMEEQMKVWTSAYRPFILGGNVNAPIWCDIEPASAPIDLGKGYQGAVIVSPSGKTFVVEVITGGIVGSTVEGVKADIASAEDSILKEQMERESRRAETAEKVSPEDFWRQLKA